MKAGNLPETIRFQKSGSIEQESTLTYQPSNNSTKFSLGPRGNKCRVGSQISCYTPRFAYRSPNTTFKTSGETHPSKSYVMLAIMQSPTPQKNSKFLGSVQFISFRRTSGCCLVMFRAVNILFQPVEYIWSLSTPFFFPVCLFVSSL